MPEATHLASGKVREIYALDDERLLLVASDRISTFDVVLPTPIPDKGRVLTGLSAFWFARTREIVRTTCSQLGPDGRSLDCRRLEMLPVEFVVRGYLAGSGWVDYRRHGHGLRPRAAARSRRVRAAARADRHAGDEGEEGHDLNITEAEAAALCGDGAYGAARAAALALYAVRRRRTRRQRGIILADTKFEFGVDADGVVTLGDEALTPDSSRFWPADGYAPGRPQPSFDKQYVRDWCLATGWDRTAPGPELAGRRGRGHPGAVRRGVRAAHRDRRSTRTSPTRRWCCEG